MPRPISEQCRQVLVGGSFNLEYVADLYYDGARRFEGLPISASSFTWDESGEVEGSAKVTVTWTDAHGASLSPREPQDWLAPFGARLVVYAVVSAGSWAERVQLGDFDITAVPSADDSVFVLGQTRITVGSTVELELKDRMVEVQRDRFTRLSSPASLTSVYVELGRLTGFQLTRSVPDAPISRSVIYEEDRFKAVADLAAILNGAPFMEWDGTLSVRPTAPPAPSGVLAVGENGTITQLGSSLDAEGVYNGIIIRSETQGQQQVLAEKWVESGPLRATAASTSGGKRTPFHNVPRFYSNPQIDTTEKALKAAPGLLESYSQPRATELQIQCIADPSIQIGDVRKVTENGVTWTVRVTKADLGNSPTMSITGSVLNRAIDLD